MRSGTSFFNPTVFKKTVTRYWPVWAVYLAIWAVALPLRLLTGFQRWGVPDAAQDVWSALSSSIDGMLTLTVVFAAVAAMAVFSHLYNTRSANFFGALPVRREGLFLTHYLAGLAFLLVPDLIVGALTLLVGMPFGANCLTAVLYWLAIACGAGFFFYSFAVFCGMFAGHILALPVFYAIFNALAAALCTVFRYIFSEFYYGFRYDGMILPEAVQWLTPTSKMAGDVFIDAEEKALHGGGTLAVYAVAAVALTVFAFLLYRRRRLETAGDVVAVRPTKPVFKYSVSFCAGLFLGWFTTLVLDGSEGMWAAASVFWAVAGCFAAQMILDKSFKVFRKWKGPVVMGLVFCALFAVVRFDLTGFETRVPETADVERVTIDDLRGTWSGNDWYGVDTGNPERVRDFVILHRAAVDQRDGWTDRLNENVGYAEMTLTYHLKSGGTLTREYSFYIDAGRVNEEGSPAWALERIYADRELIRMGSGLDQITGELESVSYENEDWWNREELDENGELTPEWEFARRNGAMSFYGPEARELLEAALADFDAGRLAAPHVGQERATARSLSFEMQAEDGGRPRRVQVEIPETATEVIAVLDRLIPELVSSLG